MIYSDEVISFAIPEYFCNGKVKLLHADTWHIALRNACLNISVPRGLYQYSPTLQGVYDECRRIDLRSSHKFQQLVIPIPVSSNPFVKEGFYSLGHSAIPNAKKVNCDLRCCLLCDNVVLCISCLGLLKMGESIPFEILIPTINSITFNLEAYNKKVELFEKKNEKRFKKAKMMFEGKGVDFIYSPPFENVEPVFSVGSVLFENEHSRVQIFNLSGLGREADIDLFEERVRNKTAENRTGIYSMSRKKCMVENMDEKQLDFRRCRHISVLLAFRGKCFSVLIQSKNEFNLDDYKEFLDSIGSAPKKK